MRLRTLALAWGYFWAARDADARRGYLWAASVFAKSLGALVFVLDHLLNGSPPAFLLLPRRTAPSPCSPSRSCSAGERRPS